MKALGCFLFFILGGVIVLLALARNFLKIFLGNFRPPHNDNPSDSSQSSSNPSSPDAGKAFKADEGEYVDYEEVKDDSKQ